MVASIIQGLAVKTPLKAQGFVSDESLMRSKGRTGRNVMQKLSGSVNLTQLQLSAPPCTWEGLSVTGCSRQGSPQRRLQPWALFCFLFHLNESLWGPRPAAASPSPHGSHTRPGDLAPSHTTGLSAEPPPRQA